MVANWGDELRQNGIKMLPENNIKAASERYEVIGMLSSSKSAWLRYPFLKISLRAALLNNLL